MINGMIFTCGTWLPNWDDPGALAYPAAWKQLGGNWVALDIYVQVPNWNAASLSTSVTLADSKIVAQVQAAKAAGVKIALKVHLVTADGSNQIWICPGVWSYNPSNPSNGFTGAWDNTSGTPNQVSCANWDLTSVAVGDRIVTPNVGHFGEIPNSGYPDAYAQAAAPSWTTIASKVNSTTVALSVNVASRNTGTGQALILSNTLSAAFFTAYTSVIDHLMGLADPYGGFDGVCLATENDCLTRYHASQFRVLVAHVRTGRPGLLVWVDSGEGLTYQGDVPFTDALDFFGISAYPTLDTLTGGASLAAMTSSWASQLTGPAAAAQAWGKPLLFAEVGARSILGAAYQPYSGRATPVQDPSQDQATFTQAMLAATKGQSWFGGFFWWCYYNPPQGAGSEAGAYSPKPLTQSAFSDALLSGRRITARSGRRFRS